MPDARHDENVSLIPIRSDAPVGDPLREADGDCDGAATSSMDYQAGTGRTGPRSRREAFEEGVDVEEVDGSVVIGVAGTRGAGRRRRRAEQIDERLNVELGVRDTLGGGILVC